MAQSHRPPRGKPPAFDRPPKTPTDTPQRSSSRMEHDPESVRKLARQSCRVTLSLAEIEFSLHRPRSPPTSVREWLPADDALDRFVQLLRKIGIEFSNLGRVSDEAFIRRLHVFGLHFERLFHRFGAHELLCSSRVILERSLGVICKLDGNCLEGLRHGAKRFHRSLHVFLLYLVNVLWHVHPPTAFRGLTLSRSLQRLELTHHLCCEFRNRRVNVHRTLHDRVGVLDAAPRCARDGLLVRLDRLHAHGAADRRPVVTSTT